MSPLLVVFEHHKELRVKSTVHTSGERPNSGRALAFTSGTWDISNWDQVQFGTATPKLWISLRRASIQNWRFPLKTEIRDDNPRIAQLAVGGLLGRDQWANPIPVASGVLNSTANKKAAVDPSHRNQAGDFDLIERKMLTQSGHALFGAMEVI
jgi:hypothetical protein